MARVIPELICFRYNPGPRRTGNSIIGNPVEAKYGVSHEQIVDAYRTAAARGAKVYLASMFVVPADLEEESARLRSYCVRHSMTVALANFGGPSGGLAAGGGSAIWSEQGELLVRLERSGSGVAIAVLEETGWRCVALELGATGQR